MLFVYGAATNDNYQWDTYRKYLFDQRISKGAWVTIQVTIWAMVLGIVLGIVLAVMRLTPNPVLQTVAWVYLWIFRGTPVYVQLVFWGLFTIAVPAPALRHPVGADVRARRHAGCRRRVLLRDCSGSA